MQRICDILVGGNHRALILGCSLFQRGLRSALSVQQRTALEYRLGDAADQSPERAARPEYPGKFIRITAQGAGDRELRQHRGDRDADLGIRGMQLSLSGPYIRSLLDDPGRQAQWQLRRQLQCVELEGLWDILVRQVADQYSNQIARLLELLLQW